MSDRKLYEKAYSLWNLRKRKRLAKEHYKDNRLKYKFWHLKAKCKQDNIPFNLTLDDLTIPEYCPILGTKLEFGERKQTGTSPSVDRIDPSKGYVKGNVWVISLKANRMKSDATIEELRKFADWVKTFQP